MEFTKPRATMEEVLDFANAVREAGGGNPLDALMPAVPRDDKQCLIARNLNFNCVVRCRTEDMWLMATDERTRDAIAGKLGLLTTDFQAAEGGHPRQTWLDVMDGEGIVHAVILPPEIGRVANDFDAWLYAVSDRIHDLVAFTPRSKELLTTFSPYVEASVRETQSRGKINERGELVL